MKGNLLFDGKTIFFFSLLLVSLLKESLLCIPFFLFKLVRLDNPFGQVKKTIKFVFFENPFEPLSQNKQKRKEIIWGNMNLGGQRKVKTQKKGEKRSHSSC